MAQLDLALPHRHPLPGKNVAEYGFDLLVGKFVPCRHRFIQTESPRSITVDGKIMRRSSLLYCAARVRHQHVVEVVKERKKKGVITCQICRSPPGMGNTAGGLLAYSRSLVKGEGLMIATWARPPRLTRGAAGVSLSPAPDRRKTARRGCFRVGWDRSASCPAWCLMGQAPLVMQNAARHGASSRVARWGRNVPAMLGMQFSR